MFKLVMVSTLMAGLVFAQAPPPSPRPFAGALVSFNDSSATLKDKDGQTVTIQMTAGWTASSPRVVSATTIKPGDFVATQNSVVDAGTGRATEVRILEPGYRPEYSSHGMEGSPNQMTHALVESAVKAGADVELKVTYPGGSRRIVVPGGVTVTVFDLHERATLKPGVQVSGVTRADSDGVRRAGRLVLAP